MTPESLELVVGFIRGVTDPIVVTDLEFKITFINSAFESLFGYRTEEIIGCYPDMLNAETDADLIQKELYAQVSQGNTFTGRSLNRKKDGSLFKCEYTVMPIKHPNGDTYAYMGILKDITTYEERLKEDGAEWIKRYIDHAPIGIIVYKPSGEIIRLNDKLIQMSGYPKEAVLAMNVFSIIASQDHLVAQEAHFKLLESGHFNGNLRIRPLHSDERIWHLTAIRVDDDELMAFVEDVTEQENLRRQNAAFEEQWRILIDTIATQVWYLKDATTYGQVNQAYAAFRGRPKSDFTGRSLFDVFPESQAEAFVASNRLVFETGKSYKDLVTIPNIEGNLRILSITKTPKLSDSGSVEYVVCSAEDVTEREQANAILKANEERFRHLVQNSSDIIEILDMQGTILYISDQVKRILGYEPDQVRYCNAFDLMHPEDTPRVMALFHEGIKVPGIQLEASYRYRHMDGHWVYFHAVGTNYLDDPVIQGIVLNARDITSQHRAEEELRKAIEIVENINIGLHVYHLEHLGDDRTLRMVYANPASARLTGIPVADVIGKTLDESFPQLRTMGVPQRYAEVVRSQEAVEFEDLVYSDERIVLSAFSVKVFPLLGNQVAVAFENITEKKQIEAEVLQARDAAQEASLAKTRFLAHMSHEIRTPLNSIIGFSELLGLTPLSKVQKDYCENIHLSGNALLGIINDILDMSKIEAGRLELDPDEVAIGELLHESVELLRYQAQIKHQVLQLVVAPDMPEYIVVDALRLKQVLVNLLSNAVKFTELGEIQLLAKFEDLSDGPMASDKFGRFTFEVTDTGIGMSRDQIDRLFRPFAQADHSIARRFGGTGLGLVISKLLVEKMGGTIQVTSALGQGSTFKVSLETSWSAPQAMTQSAVGLVTAPRAPWREGEDQVDKAFNILVVDDNLINLMLVNSMLKKVAPVAVIERSSSGHEAIAMWEKAQFDLILMDVQMPDLDGLTATEKIRARERERGHPNRTKIVGLSAGILEEERLAALEAGMDSYLTKPIDLKALEALLRSL